MSKRTGETPKRLLGAFFFFVGAGLLSYSMALIVPNEVLWTPLDFEGRISCVLAFVLVAIFTQRWIERDDSSNFVERC